MAANVNKKTKETTIVKKVPTVFIVYSFSGVPKYYYSRFWNVKIVLIITPGQLF
jgi:hypothetical protein